MNEPTLREYLETLVDQERVLREKCVGAVEQRLSEALRLTEQRLIDNANLMWGNHQTAHTEHTEAHKSEHTSTKESVSKAEITAKDSVRASEQSIEKQFDRFGEKAEELSKRVSALELAQRGTVGRDQGVSLSWGVLVVVIGIVLTILFFVLSGGGGGGGI